MDPAHLALPIGASYILKKLCSRSLEELGELLSDRVRLWRYKNEIAILSEAADYAERTGLPVNELPLKILLPLLDGASREEEPPLRTLWARLLVNASSSSASVSVCALAAQVLQALSTQDAKVLDGLFKEVQTVPAEDTPFSWGSRNGVPHLAVSKPGEQHFQLVPRDRLLAITGLSREEFELSFDNITRFNLIEAPAREDLDGRELERDHYAFTRLGWQVMALLQEYPSKTATRAE